MKEWPLDGKLVPGDHSAGVGADKCDIRSNSHVHDAVWDGHLHRTTLTWKDNHRKENDAYSHSDDTLSLQSTFNNILFEEFKGRRRYNGLYGKSEQAIGMGGSNKLQWGQYSILCGGEVITPNWVFLLYKDGLTQRFLNCYPGTLKGP